MQGHGEPLGLTSAPSGGAGLGQLGHLGHHRAPGGGVGPGSRCTPRGGRLHAVEAGHRHPGRVGQHVEEETDWAAGDHGHQGEPAGEVRQHLGRTGQRPGGGRVVDDRGQGAVVVDEEGGVPGPLA